MESANSVSAFHPSLEGWNPDWEKKFGEVYGYNPTKAKALLTDAGYGAAGSLKIKVYQYPLSGLPEYPQVQEAMQIMLRAVGGDLTLESIDASRVNPLYRNRELQCCLYSARPKLRPMEEQILSTHQAKGALHVFEDDFIEERYAKLTQTVDPAERDRILRDIGDHLFDEINSIPLFWIRLEAMVNPRIVEDWTWPSTASGGWSHWNLVKAAK